MPDNSNWVTSTFTRDQLDNKGVYFPLSPQGPMVFGHMHVTAQNNPQQFQITIDYGGLDSTGAMQSGTRPADQAFMDALRPVDFVAPTPPPLPPPTGLRVTS